MTTDSHCHLDYFDDVPALIEEATKAGVQRMLHISLQNWKKDQKLAHTYGNLYYAVGLYPANTHKESLNIPSMEANLQDSKCVGVGETGLDSTCGVSLKTQIPSFIQQIQIARKHNKALIVHTREAEKETTALLTNEYKKSPFKAIIHCFTGSQSFANAMLNLGFYISFSGILTFKNAEYLRDIAKTVPLDKILVETDSPYLAPTPYRGKRNQPAYVVETLKILANTINKPVETLSQITDTNFNRLFLY